MGKSSQPAAPAAPDYSALAREQANLSKINEVGPTGSVTWNGQTRTTSLSPEQQALYNQMTGTQQAVGGLAQGMVGQLGPDAAARQNLSDALYKQSTRYYDRNFGDQESALRSQLINSGLTEGSEAYSKALGDFNQRRDTAYGDAANTAAIGAEQQSQANQSNAVNRLMALLNYSRFGDGGPQATTGYQTPDLMGAAQSTLGANNAASARRSGMMSGLGGALGTGAGFLIGGPVGAGIGGAIGSGLGGLF